jgi:hypothetical protein
MPRTEVRRSITSPDQDADIAEFAVHCFDSLPD